MPGDMATTTLRVLGGPTALIEIGGVRLLIDPTFDGPGDYPLGTRTLTKTEPAAWTAEQVGPVDAVLLSHDQHPDNLDHGGRRFLDAASLVLTTASGATRLGGNARALPNWTSVGLPRRGAHALTVLGVPAQHGPDGTEHLTGEVTGFVVSGPNLPVIYISGDNASLEVVTAVAQRCRSIDVAVLFAGGAQTPLLGDAYLTLTSEQAARATVILGKPRVIVVHTDGWQHFTQGAQTLAAAFGKEDVLDRLIPLRPGDAVDL